jgi:hypothetical protein
MLNLCQEDQMSGIRFETKTLRIWRRNTNVHIVALTVEMELSTTTNTRVDVWSGYENMKTWRAAAAGA